MQRQVEDHSGTAVLAKLSGLQMEKRIVGEPRYVRSIACPSGLLVPENCRLGENPDDAEKQQRTNPRHTHCFTRYILCCPKPWFSVQRSQSPFYQDAHDHGVKTDTRGPTSTMQQVLLASYSDLRFDCTSFAILCLFRKKGRRGY